MSTQVLNMSLMGYEVHRENECWIQAFSFSEKWMMAVEIYVSDGKLQIVTYVESEGKPLILYMNELEGDYS